MKKNSFKTEFKTFDRRSTVERALDDFLNKCLGKEAHIESHHSATKLLLERYMAVVRRRNSVRRNWHPEQARACDIQALMWIPKENFKNTLDRRLREALVVTSNGDKAILEKCIDELVEQITKDTFKSNRKNLKPSPLEKIVRTILKSNPEATCTEVINTMKATPREFGIVEIDDRYVTIQVTQGAGRQLVTKPRSLATVNNILTRVKTPYFMW